MGVLELLGVLEVLGTLGCWRYWEYWDSGGAVNAEVLRMLRALGVLGVLRVLGVQQLGVQQPGVHRGLSPSTPVPARPLQPESPPSCPTGSVPSRVQPRAFQRLDLSLEPDRALRSLPGSLSSQQGCKGAASERAG